MSNAFKIARLDLLAYGPFTGQSLDLAAGSAGLHIVYGPNEAGKSTTLRALRGLLFGIDPKTDDNHLHAYNDLRIGAVIRVADGSTLHVIRRKGNKNTLRDADDTTPVDPKILEFALGHIDDRAFDARFGINHDQLVAGGKEIANGEGDVGQLLFAASAGIAHLSQLQARLVADASELYKPSGSKPAINAALNKLKVQSKQLRGLQLSASQWEQQEGNLSDAKAELDRLERELAALESTKKRLERYAAALPLASRRAALLEELAALGEVPALSEAFCERRRELTQRRHVATEAERSAAVEIARLDERLAELGSPPAILASAATIDQIGGELSSHLKAAKDRVGLYAELSQLDRQIEAAIRRIGGSAGNGDEVRIEIRAADRARVEELGHAHHEASARRETAERRRVQAQLRLDELGAELAALPVAADGDSLKRLLRRVQPLVAEGAKLGIDAARLSADERQLVIDLSRFPHWMGEIDAVETLTVPNSEAVSEFESRLATDRAALDRAIERQASAAQDAASVDEKLEALVESAAVPTEEGLVDARQARDNAWAALRGALAGGDVPCAQDLAGKFEILAAAADSIADGLRRDAEGAARRSALEEQSCRHADVLARAKEHASERRRAYAETKRQWKALWQSLGIAPAAPREMQKWLVEHRRICDASAELRRRRAEQLAVAARVDEAKREVVRLLASFDETADGASDGASDVAATTLAQAVERGEQLWERVEGQRDHRRGVEIERDQSIREARESAEEIAHADAELNAWRASWTAAIAPLGHVDELSPRQAQAVLSAVAEMESFVEKRHDRATRIAGIDRDATEYVARLTEAIDRAAADIDVGGLSTDNVQAVENAVAEVVRRLSTARREAAERQTLLAARVRKAADWEGARERTNVAAAELEALGREACVATVDELPATEERWRKHIEMRRRADELEARLHDHAGGAALVEFLVELAAVDADGLDAERSRADLRLSELIEHRDRLRERVWSLDRDAEQSLGRADAAEIHQGLENLRSQLEDDVARYARLRVASAVLRRAIERYRDKNEAPLLRRAGEVFSRLTCGAFAELRTDYDDQRPVLVAVRAETGKTVGVAGMSDGTCDQLYLALRLASVEQYIDAHPPIPFIVDDVLQRFDDRRAAAALAALAELARRTQVIFFTHHQHVLELAAQHLAEGDYVVHRLGDEETPVAKSRRRRTPKTAKAADATAPLF